MAAAAALLLWRWKPEAPRHTDAPAAPVEAERRLASDEPPDAGSRPSVRPLESLFLYADIERRAPTDAGEGEGVFARWREVETVRKPAGAGQPKPNPARLHELGLVGGGAAEGASSTRCSRRAGAHSRSRPARAVLPIATTSCCARSPASRGRRWRACRSPSGLPEATTSSPPRGRTRRSPPSPWASVPGSTSTRRWGCSTRLSRSAVPSCASSRSSPPTRSPRSPSVRNQGCRPPRPRGSSRSARRPTR